MLIERKCKLPRALATSKMKMLPILMGRLCSWVCFPQLCSTASPVALSQCLGDDDQLRLFFFRRLGGEGLLLNAGMEVAHHVACCSCTRLGRSGSLGGLKNGSYLRAVWSSTVPEAAVRMSHRPSGRRGVWLTTRRCQCSHEDDSHCRKLEAPLSP